MAYSFFGKVGVNDDASYLTEREIQNSKVSNYATTNFRTGGSHFKSTQSVAYTQPGLIVHGGPGVVGVKGYNVDSDTSLRVKAKQTRDPCPVSLQTRPYVTVPYLGRGHTRPGEESLVQQGVHVSSRKTVTGLSEKTHLEHSQTPLIPSVASKITNPENLVEGVASSGWIRGGIPSREFFRNHGK